MGASSKPRYGRRLPNRQAYRIAKPRSIPPTRPIASTSLKPEGDRRGALTDGPKRPLEEANTPLPLSYDHWFGIVVIPPVSKEPRIKAIRYADKLTWNSESANFGIVLK